MEPSLELFDRHADEIFQQFLLEGQTRTQALASTEAVFLAYAGAPVGSPIPSQKPYFKAYFSRTKRLMKFSS